jgi:hypothetical protein
MLECTNSLETALVNTQDHAAALTTTQDNRLQQLEAQQPELLAQTTKFMALLSSNQHTPNTSSNASGHACTPRQNTPKTSTTSPRYCNSCKMSNVYHEDDAWYALERNKEKRPQWYAAKK